MILRRIKVLMVLSMVSIHYAKLFLLIFGYLTCWIHCKEQIYVSMMVIVNGYVMM